MMEPLIDFAIITAIESERRAVCEAFGMTHEDRNYRDARTYYRKRLTLEDGKFYEIVLAQLPDMGNSSAGLLVADIRQHWEPGVILLVGIAGSANEELALGDLVVASDVYYYERGKETSEGKIPESQMFKPDATLWDRVSNIAPWTNPILADRPDRTKARPMIHRGVIASGEKVLADAAVRDRIVANHRKIKAIEMEGYGFSLAAWQSYRPVRHLMLKAISDLADDSKNDEWQPYAAAVAASFAKHFLLDCHLPPRNPPELKNLIVPSDSDLRFRKIISAFKCGTVVPFLGSGINWCDRNFNSNGNASNQDSLCDIEIAKQLSEVIMRELGYQGSESQLIEKILGVPCLICYGDLKNRSLCSPMLDQMTEGIGSCNSSKFDISIEQKLAIAKLDFRFLAKYYLLHTSTNQLYVTLNILYDKHSQPNCLHNFLAELPGKQELLAGLPPYQLIITTNYDNLLERAFKSARQSFDVVSYIAEGDCCHKFRHKRYKHIGNGEFEPEEDFGVIENPKKYSEFEMSTYPVILKLFGSLQDNNCVITEDHQIDYLTNRIFEDQVPSSLKRIIKDNSILFLGYSLNDYNLKLILNQIWNECKRESNGKSWLIHPSEHSSYDQTLWEGRKIKHFKCSLKYFLEKLNTGINNEIVRHMK